MVSIEDNSVNGVNKNNAMEQKKLEMNECNITHNNVNKFIDDEIEALLKRTHNKNKTALVLSGGSIRGVAQLGSMHCLKNNGKLNDINTIVGSSVGAIIGLFYVIGYEPIEVFELLKLIDMEKINDSDPMKNIKHFGMDDGTRIMLVIEKLFVAKKYDKNTTMDELYRKTKKTYILTGSCINDKKCYYFSHQTYPSLKVLDAVRISISLPIMYTPITMDNKIFVDGCFTDNFPLQIFGDKIDTVIGIYIREKMQTVKDIKYIEDYLFNTFNCFISGFHDMSTKLFDKNIIVIHCDKMGATMTQNDIIGMFDQGYRVTLNKINNGDL
jgi:predicted acylesterase/phospholipase RssA